MMEPPTEFAVEPRLPALTGTVIANTPPVTVTVAVLVPMVSAEAGAAIPMEMRTAAAAAIAIRAFMTVSQSARCNGTRAY